MVTLSSKAGAAAPAGDGATAAHTPLSADAVWSLLRHVKDPEIPAISIVDLGIVEHVDVEATRVEVMCLPTFVGCPALDVIRKDIEAALRSAGAEARVRFVLNPAWTTDRITPEGRRRLQEYGLAPPAPAPNGDVHLTLLTPGRCPYCGSADTVLESPFGPTLCRATCYCRSCRNPFEQFKPV